jgi:hypothetical protein
LLAEYAPFSGKIARSALPRAHAIEERAHQVERRDEIDVERGSEVFDARRLDARQLERAGVVDDHVRRPAKLATHAFDELHDRGMVGEVAWQRDRVRAQLGGSGVESIRRARDENHSHALAHEPTRDLQPDSARRARHDRRATPQRAHSPLYST